MVGHAPQPPASVHEVDDVADLLSRVAISHSVGQHQDVNVCEVGGGDRPNLALPALDVDDAIEAG